jgi:5-methylcytosine-specific restriction endonuclease McrA
MINKFNKRNPVLYPTVIVEVKKEKKTKEKIPTAVKKTLWSLTFPNGSQGTCYCCKTEVISQTNFDCGHIISEKNGGKVELDNLKPICPSCNSSMGTKNMDDYIKEFGF